MKKGFIERVLAGAMVVCMVLSMWVPASAVETYTLKLHITEEGASYKPNTKARSKIVVEDESGTIDRNGDLTETLVWFLAGKFDSKGAGTLWDFESDAMGLTIEAGLKAHKHPDNNDNNVTADTNPWFKWINTFADEERITGDNEDKGDLVELLKSKAKIGAMTPNKEYVLYYKINAKDNHVMLNDGTEFELAANDPAKGNTYIFTLTLVKQDAGSKYSINVNSDSHGTAFANPTTAKAKETVIITTDADEGYAVSGVRAMAGRTSIPIKNIGNGKYSFVMPNGHVTVDVTTKAQNYTVKVKNENNGSAEVDRNNAQAGETVTIWPDADKGYEVEDVTITDATGAVVIPIENPDGSYSFVMPVGGVTVGTNTKLRKYNVGTYIDRGRIETDAVDGKAHMGDRVKFTTRVEPGYVVHNITVTIVAPVLRYRLMAAPRASTLDFTDHGNGEYSVIAPADDFLFSVTTTRANYAVNMGTVTNGSATTSQNSAAVDDTVTITPDIDDGYVVNEVKVTTGTGVNIPVTPNPDGTFDFDMQEEDVEITVTTKLKEYDITVNSVPNGEANVDKNSATASEIVTITPDIDDGYVVNEVKVTTGTGAAVPVTPNPDGETYSFVMPVGDVEVEMTTMAKPSSGSGYLITVNEVANGNAIPSAERAEEDETVTITPSALAGHKVVDVKVTTGTDVVISVTQNADGTFSFTMPDGDVEVTVTTKANEYDVKVESANNGRVTTNVESAAAGETVTITASADKGHEVTGIKVTQEGNHQTVLVEPSNEGEATFTMPVGAVIVTVVTEPKKYTVTVDSGATGNFTSDAEFGKATMGETVTITGNAALGHEVESITVTSQSEGTFEVLPDHNGDLSFRMPADDVEITVTTKLAEYPVNVYANANSNANVDMESAKMDDTVTITASADAGYELKVEVTSANGPVQVTSTADETYTFKMTPGAANVTVTAVPKQYHIDVEDVVNAEATTKVNGIEATVGEAGQTVTITPTAEPGFVVSDIKIVSEGEEVPFTKNDNGTYSFEIPVGDVTVTLTTMAEPSDGSGYPITVNDAANGFVSTDVEHATEGETVTVTTNSYTGHVVHTVEVTQGTKDIVVTDNGNGTYSFTMPDGEVEVTMVTRAEVYPITVNSVSNGKANVDKNSATAGETVTIKPEADQGYEVSAVKVTCGTTPVWIRNNGDGTYSFTMPAGDATIDVTTAAKKYAVNVKPVVNGAASVDKAQAKTGETVTITTASNEGYMVSAVTVKQGTKSVAVTNKGNGKYVFTMPAGDVTVEVEFKNATGGNVGGGGGSEAKDYAIIVNSVENGTATADATRAEAGKKITVAATANEGYEVDAIKVTQGTKDIVVTDNGDGTYSFTMPEGAVSVTVTFKKKALTDPTDSNHGNNCPASRFDDVDLDAWYHKAVDYVVYNGLMAGFDENSFGPDWELSRAMVAQIFFNLEGQPSGEYNNPFPDVAEGKWYYNAITWAFEHGVVSGYGDGLYRPEKVVSREELVQIYCNYAKAKGWSEGTRIADLTIFVDYQDVAPWHEVAVSWGVGSKLLGGKGGNVMAPKESATRAEAAQMLMNMCENIQK